MGSFGGWQFVNERGRLICAQDGDITNGIFGSSSKPWTNHCLQIWTLQPMPRHGLSSGLPSTRTSRKTCGGSCILIRRQRAHMKTIFAERKRCWRHAFLKYLDCIQYFVSLLITLSSHLQSGYSHLGTAFSNPESSPLEKTVGGYVIPKYVGSITVQNKGMGTWLKQSPMIRRM